jgi:hypothetical protein
MSIKYTTLPWHKMPNSIMTDSSDVTKPGFFADLSLLEWRLLLVLQWQVNNGKRVKITNQELMDFTKMDRDDLRRTRSKLTEDRRLFKATKVDKKGTVYFYEEAIGANGLTATGKPVKKNVTTGHRRKSKEPDDTEEKVASEPNGTQPVDT